MVFIIDAQALDGMQALHLTLRVGRYALETPAVADDHALFNRTGHFFLAGRHLFALLQADQGHILGAHALGGQRHVHGHVAAAAHQHVVGNVLFQEAVNLHQEIQAELRQVFARDAQDGLLPRAGAEKHFIVAGHQFLGGYILPHLGVHAELNAHARQRIGKLLHNVLGQTIVGNAVVQHAACLFMRVDHRYGMPRLAQEVRRAQARRARAHHSHTLAGFLFGSLIEGIRMRQDIIAQRALHAVDGHRLAIAVLVALILAGMGADARGQHGHRIGVHDQARRFVPVIRAD